MTEVGKGRVESKICESCREIFGCGARVDGCWCVDVEIPSEVATGLKARYVDCLCPKCLKLTIAGPEKK